MEIALYQNDIAFLFLNYGFLYEIQIDFTYFDEFYANSFNFESETLINPIIYVVDQ